MTERERRLEEALRGLLTVIDSCDRMNVVPNAKGEKATAARTALALPSTDEPAPGDVSEDELAELERLFSDDPKHAPGCPTVADDESDHECLTDAGRCACGVWSINTVRVNEFELVDALGSIYRLLAEIRRRRGQGEKEEGR